MTFNPCSDCGGVTGRVDVARLAILWFVPTVLFVLWRQRPEHRLVAPLRPVLGLSVFVALVVTLAWASGRGSNFEVTIVAVPALCVESVLCAIAILAGNYAQRGSPSHSS